ncbi:sensor histidine kinase [Paraburkholderia rhizosphaerae]|uniref:histidine kinase n=1 Tax=Paraburkholderia rhizosphaerae TaxID=480658 RepID=A0A4R8L6I7_9BURK|nr:ATP-binding protein [Paraburkholderia rhizosphaerae]TDY38233.1 phospho-acceptor domain-containing protein [Paraburkholderia rhizosphaerae]
MLNQTVGARIHQVTERIGLASSFGGGLRKKWNVLKVSPKQAMILAAALTLFTFVLDCYLPVPLNVAKLYLFVVIVLAWTRSTRWLWSGAVVVAALSVVILTIRSGPAGNQTIITIDWANRFFTAGMLLVVAGLVHAGMAILAARQRAEEALRRAEADFAHAARISMLGELAASIAHELKQPLTAISINGQAELRWLGEPAPNLVEARDATTRMLAEAQRAAEIIDRIRRMAIRQTPEQTLVSLDALIDEALVFLEPELRSRGVSAFHPLASDMPKVLADRVQVQQVIVNLAVNAMQAIEQADSPQRKITISTAMPNATTVSCAVEDSGPGVVPEHAEHLFERFYTTKQSGMGMGLSICRSIIEGHGGKIAADAGSAHGGARFYFTLPVADIATG